MTSAWTARQFAVVRSIVGLAVAVGLVTLMVQRWTGIHGGVGASISWFVGAFALLGVGFAVLTAIGVRTPFPYAGAAMGVIVLMVSEDFVASPAKLALIGVAWLPAVLDAVVWSPPSLRDREGPGPLDSCDVGAMPRRAFAAVWVSLGLVTFIAGFWAWTQPSWRLGEAMNTGALADAPWWAVRLVTWLVLGAWLSLGPIALSRTARPWAWCAGLVIHGIGLPLAGYGASGIVLIAWYLMAFNPAWLPAKTGPRETVFYDGNCGFCFRVVHGLIVEDRLGAFEFAPLKGQRIRELISATRREELPDSVLVLREGNEILAHSEAVAHILDRLGGVWRVLAWGLWAIPEPVRDWGYRMVDSSRPWLSKLMRGPKPELPTDRRGRLLP